MIFNVEKMIQLQPLIFPDTETSKVITNSLPILIVLKLLIAAIWSSHGGGKI